jgi:hypothetical protein
MGSLGMGKSVLFELGDLIVLAQSTLVYIDNAHPSSDYCLFINVSSTNREWASASPISAAWTASDETYSAAAVLGTRIIGTDSTAFIRGISLAIISILVADIRLSVVGEEDWVGLIGGIGWRRWTVSKASFGMGHVS